MNEESTRNLPIIVGAALAALVGFTIVFVLIAALVMIAVGNTEEVVAEPLIDAASEAAIAEATTEITVETPDVDIIASTDTVLEEALQNAHSPATLQTGAEIFALRCSPCHGPDGEGTVIAPSFVDFTIMPYDFVESRVRSGPEVMSAFTEAEINTEQLTALVAYLEENIVGTAIPEFTEADIEQGRQYWREFCSECHGSRAQGKNDYGPPLTIWPPFSISGVIQGARIPLPGMPRISITDDELVYVAIWLQNLGQP